MTQLNTILNDCSIYARAKGTSFYGSGGTFCNGGGGTTTSVVTFRQLDGSTTLEQAFRESALDFLL